MNIVKIAKELVKMFYRYIKYYILRYDKNLIFFKSNTFNFLELNSITDNNIINEADEIIKGRINILGINKYYKNKKWNCDLNTNFEWKNKYYKFYKIINGYNNSDIKIPWEISRFQHMPIVAQAYFLSEEKKYIDFIKNEINDWIDENPYLFSVNWKCAMDVSIRAINLIVTSELIGKSKDLDETFLNKINGNLYLHGKFIYNNLEKYEYTGNHYMADLIGLVWISLYLYNGQDEIQEWLVYALREIEHEVFIQFNEDGTNYENSTAYHKFVLEMILLTIIICKKNDVDNFDGKFYSRIEKALDFIFNISNNNSEIQLIGDNDNGRILVLSNYLSWRTNDCSNVLAMGGEIFCREDFRKKGLKAKLDIRKIFVNKKECKYLTRDSLKEYKNGGFYVIENSNIKCLIRCGDLSFHGKGTHSHNDQLSFTLNIKDVDTIIDPGTFVYTSNPKLRNKYRSTSMHNTVQIENYEQNTITNKLFDLKEETFGQCIKFSGKEFHGKHFGFEKKCNVIHERKFILEEDYLNIIDNIIGYYKSMSIKSYIILNSDTKIVHKNNNFIVINNGNNDIRISTDENNSIYLEDEYVSKSYGEQEKTTKVVIIYNNKINSIKIDVV